MRRTLAAVYVVAAVAVWPIAAIRIVNLTTGRNKRIPAERQRQSRSAGTHADRRTKRNRTRSNQRRSAINDQM